jgi:hypothetical protein
MIFKEFVLQEISPQTIPVKLLKGDSEGSYSPYLEQRQNVKLKLSL